MAFSVRVLVDLLTTGAVVCQRAAAQAPTIAPGAYGTIAGAAWLSLDSPCTFASRACSAAIWGAGGAVGGIVAGQLHDVF